MLPEGLLIGWCDNDRLRRSVRLAVKYGFDIVSVGVQHKRSVVPGVVRPLARRAVVAASGTEGSLVERGDRFTIWSLKGQVNPGDLPVRLVDEELVDMEVAFAFNEALRAAEGGDDGDVEALARLYIRHPQVNMVDEPAEMKFHDVGGWGLTFEMSGGPKAAKQALERPLDGGVRGHTWGGDAATSEVEPSRPLRRVSGFAVQRGRSIRRTPCRSRPCYQFPHR
jgi:hypothetical protein